jgi:tetratricopeptide (TPR) repeat protein
LVDSKTKGYESPVQKEHPGGDFQMRMFSSLSDQKGRNHVLQFWIRGVFVILLTAIVGHATGAQQEHRDEVLIHVNQERDLQGRGDLDGVIAEYHAALRRAPSYVDAHYNLGVAWKGRGNKAEASRELHDYLLMAPESPANLERKNTARQLLKERE